MQAWLQSNWLALYGAVVGTIALVVNGAKLKQAYDKERVKLVVTLRKDENYDANVDRIKKNEGKEAWEKADLVPVFVVTVRNTGSTDAQILDVGVKTKSGAIHQALIPSPGQSSNILSTIKSTSTPLLKAKASADFNIHMRSNEAEFMPTIAYATDGTGRTWEGKRLV